MSTSLQFLLKKPIDKMAKIDKLKLKANVGKFSSVKGAALEIAESKLETEKRIFLSEFSSHPVTNEIELGPASQNISMTLGGYGNLFSFIGFNKGDQPTLVVKEMIRKIRLLKGSFYKVKGYGANISFDVSVPSIADFENNTPMPWSSGRSWLLGIERGISSFGFFISKAFSGRSSSGIQSEEKIRQGSFKNVSYFSRMYNNFINRIRKQ